MRRGPFLLTLILLSSFLFFGVQLCLGEKPIELRFTTVTTTLHPNFKSTEQFAQEVSKRTNGRVRITVYPSGTLNPPMETYNAIKTGIAQMGSAPVGYSAQVMPLNKLFGDALSGIATSQEVARLWRKAINTIPELAQEFEGIHLLWVHSTLPLCIGTKDRPISRLEDFYGLVMRFPPGLEPLAKAWGASPISMPVADIYVSLQKGIVHGFFGGAEMLKAMRLAEYTKYVTSAVMVYGLSYAGMNLKVWESLPEDVKKVFEDLSGFAEEIHCKAMDEAEKEALDFATSEGTKILKIERAELQRIHNVSKPVFEKIAEDLEKRGKPAKRILQYLSSISK